jgi:hypothetical protein
MPDPAAGCSCQVSIPGELRPFRDLGMDRHYAEASIHIAPACGHYWLRYYYVVEAFTASGRFYLGLITAEQAATLTAAEARDTLEDLPWYYYGGSYFDGRSGKASGAIRLNP